MFQVPIRQVCMYNDNRKLTSINDVMNIIRSELEFPLLQVFPLLIYVNRVC